MAVYHRTFAFDVDILPHISHRSEILYDIGTFASFGVLGDTAWINSYASAQPEQSKSGLFDVVECNALTGACCNTGSAVRSWRCRHAAGRAGRQLR